MANWISLVAEIASVCWISWCSDWLVDIPGREPPIKFLTSRGLFVMLEVGDCNWTTLTYGVVVEIY